MKFKLNKISLLGIFAAAAIVTPVWAHAQDTSTNAPGASETAPAKHKKHDSKLFHGKVTEIDASAMTLTVDTLKLLVTSGTKITKDGKPATLADIKVGENATGAYKKDSEGKLSAVVIHFGVKARKSATSDASTAPVSK